MNNLSHLLREAPPRNQKIEKNSFLAALYATVVQFSLIDASQTTERFATPPTFNALIHPNNFPIAKRPPDVGIYNLRTHHDKVPYCVIVLANHCAVFPSNCQIMLPS